MEGVEGWRLGMDGWVDGWMNRPESKALRKAGKGCDGMISGPGGMGVPTK